MFDETLLENQNWEDLKLTDKYTVCIVESPDLIDYDDCVSMIMRNEYMFRFGSGNDCEFRDWCLNIAEYPKELPEWFLDKQTPKNKEKFKNLFNKEVDDFCKRWNINPSPDIFCVDLFASPCVSGPSSFVSLKSGKVGNVINIGKWCDRVGDFKEEILWFAKTYPKYKFFLTFKISDDGYGKNRRNAYTLMLYEGKVSVVKTRTDKETDYVYKINHYYGSTLAKRPSLLSRLLDSVFDRLDYDSFLYKALRKILNTQIYVIRFFWKVYKALVSERVWFEHCLKTHEKFFEHNEEKYFDKAHARDLILYWKEMLRNEKLSS